MSAQHLSIAVLLLDLEVTCECMEYNKIFCSGSFASISFSIGCHSSSSGFAPFVQHQGPNLLLRTCDLQIVVESTVCGTGDTKN